MYVIVQKLLKFFDKKYTPDPRIPTAYLVRFCMRRLMWLAYGFLRMQRFAFIAPTVTIEQGNRFKLGRAATLEPYVRINAAAIEDVRIGERTKIGAYSRVLATAHLSKAGKYFRFGKDGGCGEFCFFGAAGGIDIGDRVIMGQYVSFHAQEHEFKNTLRSIKDQPTTEHGITVGNDCWIGAKATILDGTVIGNHCVIAAGAVVKGHFPDHSVIGGVPARILRDLKDAA